MSNNSNYYIKSVEKAFLVLNVFDSNHTNLSISELSALTNMNKATVRRFALTLTDLGYLIKTENNRFSISPMVLALSNKYLDTLDFKDLSLPILESLSKSLNESTNMAILHNSEVLYIARVTGAEKILSVNLNVGSRLPFYATSLGKTLFAWRPEEEQQKLWDKVEKIKYTKNTIIDYNLFKKHIEEYKDLGYTYSKDELEVGLHSISAPIFNSKNQLIAAINVSSQTMKTTEKKVKTEYLPELLSSATELTKLIEFYNL